MVDLILTAVAVAAAAVAWLALGLLSAAATRPPRTAEGQARELRREWRRFLANVARALPLR